MLIRNERSYFKAYIIALPKTATYSSAAPSMSSSQSGLKRNFSWGQSRGALMMLFGGTFLAGYLLNR